MLITASAKLLRKLIFCQLALISCPEVTKMLGKSAEVVAAGPGHLGILNTPTLESSVHPHEELSG